MKVDDLANLSSLARKIIQAHLDQGKTVNSLAVASGIHPSQLWLFMRGERGLTDASLEKIGRAIKENNKKR